MLTAFWGAGGCKSPTFDLGFPWMPLKLIVRGIYQPRLPPGLFLCAQRGVH